jgi:hypothetical protein
MLHFDLDASSRGLSALVTISVDFDILVAERVAA